MSEHEIILELSRLLDNLKQLLTIERNVENERSINRTN
ncbi:hypothetical protein CLPUN_32680 [Clostridium puniceum]|uniref:Uncharacterized protein n=1 Tax=Clostridium puniceum TaxID=29367 RepID=A0A1S8TCA3_9CLOT|nr:hypothetical protein CLPUN_32680 [Clostridium puniceum]